MNNRRNDSTRSAYFTRASVLGLFLTALLTIPSLLAAASGNGNLPELGKSLLDRMMHDPFEIVSDKRTGSGTMGARKWTIRFIEDGQQLKVKWKKAPGDGDGWNNSPRRELGAYAVQQLFLDPEDYVVPPSTTCCVPLQAFAKAEQQPSANLPATRCVYGQLSVWLQGVQQPKKVRDLERFAKDPLFAYHLANMNLLNYLINHQDGRKSNYLVSDDPADPRVYSVDNGLAFGVLLRNYFIRHWNRIRVPALPRKSVERLRRIRKADLERLGVLAQMEAGEDGILRHVELGANRDPSKGNRLGEGTIQIGLTAKEIDEVQKRIRKLLAKVDEGKIRLM